MIWKSFRWPRLLEHFKLPKYRFHSWSTKLPKSSKLATMTPRYMYLLGSNTKGLNWYRNEITAWPILYEHRKPMLSDILVNQTIHVGLVIVIRGIPPASLIA